MFLIPELISSNYITVEIVFFTNGYFCQTTLVMTNMFTQTLAQTHRHSSTEKRYNLHALRLES